MKMERNVELVILGIQITGFSCFIHVEKRIDSQTSILGDLEIVDVWVEKIKCLILCMLHRSIQQEWS